MTEQFSETLRLFYEPMVEKAARVVHRRAHYIDIADYEQMLWLWLIENGHASMLKFEQRRLEEGLEEGLTEAERQGIIIRQAKRFASKELDDYRHFCGDYLYQPQEVKRIILENASEDIEGRLDVEEAMGALGDINPGYRAAIEQFYIFGSTKDKTIARRAQRGIDMLASLMNSRAARTRVPIEEVEA